MSKAQSKIIVVGIFINDFIHKHQTFAPLKLLEAFSQKIRATFLFMKKRIRWEIDRYKTGAKKLIE